MIRGRTTVLRASLTGMRATANATRQLREALRASAARVRECTSRARVERTVSNRAGKHPAAFARGGCAVTEHDVRIQRPHASN